MNGALFRGGAVYRNPPSIGAQVWRARVTFSTGFACVRSRRSCRFLRGRSVAAKSSKHYILWLFILRLQDVGFANACGSGLVSRKGRKAAPTFSRRGRNPGAAARPYRDTRPLPQRLHSSGPFCGYKNAARGTRRRPSRHSGLTGRLRSQARRSRRPSALAQGPLPGPGRCRHRWKRR